MKLVHELALRYAGRPVAVLCGGPSLLGHLPAMAHAAAFISANEHGCLAHPCDFITQADVIHTVTKEDMLTRLRPYGMPIVSPLLTADYRINDWEHPSSSGLLAVWLAWLLGGNPILLAGMDCYVGTTYHHGERRESSGHQKSVEFFHKLARDLLPYMPGANVRVMSGPMTEVWPQYDPIEQFEGWAPSAGLVARAQAPRMVRIMARESIQFWKNRVWGYAQATLTETEAARFIAAGLAYALPEKPLTPAAGRAMAPGPRYYPTGEP